MKKKKIHIVLISKVYLKGHPKEGEPTHFKQKYFEKEKITTIRQNYLAWKKRADQINSGEFILHIKEWSGKPYNSKQTLIDVKQKLTVQKLDIYPFQKQIFIDGNPFTGSFYELANKDGLLVSDFVNWFSIKKSNNLTNLAILHFTDLKY